MKHILTLGTHGRREPGEDGEVKSRVYTVGDEIETSPAEARGTLQGRLAKPGSAEAVAAIKKRSERLKREEAQKAAQAAR